MGRKLDVNNINLTITNVDFWDKNNRNKGGMRIYWSSDIGFGVLDVVKREGNDGEDYESPREDMVLTVSTENMDSEEDKAFTNKIFSLLSEHLKVID